MIRSTIHIILSLLVTVSVTGFTVNVHYCQEQLYDVAMFAPAHSCCDTGEHNSMDCHDSPDMDPDHCDDRTIQLESANDLYLSSWSSGPSLPGTYHLLPADHTVLDRYDKPGSERPANLCRYRFPPTGKQDILSRIQSYLI